MRLDDDQLVELAELVAAIVCERLSSPATSAADGLVDVSTLAGRLGVTPDFVYRHAGELGARRLGDGPRARLRFDPVEAERRLTACAAVRESEVPVSAVVEPVRRRRRSSRSGSGARLLPIRGGDGA